MTQVGVRPGIAAVVGAERRARRRPGGPDRPGIPAPWHRTPPPPTQALGADPSQAKWQRGLRTLEINPTHPLVRELKARVAAAPDAAETKNRAMVLYETCLMESGGFGSGSGCGLGLGLGWVDRVHRVRGVQGRGWEGQGVGWQLQWGGCVHGAWQPRLR